MQTLCVIDDEPLVVEAVARSLATCFQAIGFTSPLRALDFILARKADGLLVDWSMPGMTGPDLIRKVRAAGLETPAIVMSGIVSLDRIDEVYKAGGQDMVAKPPSVAELVARIRHAGVAEPEPVMVGERLCVDVTERSARVRDDAGRWKPLRLSAVQRDLLLVLARQAGRPVRDGVILDEVWGRSAEVQPHALEQSIYRLRAKLGRASSLLVRDGCGYRLGPRG